ncbi:AAA family ATPase [Saccharicrinis aurantiacus]|uniref:AAA family ATPase n=1 Tax=Saccharicrinis aurantiacus TaxID=1849719 RepID=UPI00249066E9|nr:AAA family ATPase [Saccharicrinis aurantiacus]
MNDIKTENEALLTKALLFDKIKTEISKVIIGQSDLIDKLLMALLCNGHVLIEGVPGLAKTLTINSLADTLHASFKRLQFTPDLLPGDLTGTLIYSPKDGSFETQRGPVFANIVLADEINRAPAKVQSALLEAMQEKQVTIGKETLQLPKPFFVLATQNPLEQEGTYELPEAQVDRFMFKLNVEYPSFEEEHQILQAMSKAKADVKLEPVVDIAEIQDIQLSLDEIFLHERLEKYIIRLIFATREPKKYVSEVAEYIKIGASPRATIFMAKAAKAKAFLQQRTYVTPEDIHAVAPDILRHRVVVNYKAQSRGISIEKVIDTILKNVALEEA